MPWKEGFTPIYTFNSSMTVTLPDRDAFSITGYKFDLWENNSDEPAQDWNGSGWSANMPIADQTVTAVFKPKTYSIHYYNGNTEITGQITDPAVKHIYGINTELPQNVTISSYTVQGWYSSTECSGDAVTKIEANQVPADETEGFMFYAKLALQAGISVTWPSYSGDAVIDGTPAYTQSTNIITFNVKDTYINATISAYLDAGSVSVTKSPGEKNCSISLSNQLTAGYHQLLVLAETESVTYSQTTEFQVTGSAGN